MEELFTTPWKATLVIIAVLAAVVLAVWEVVATIAARPIVYNDKDRNVRNDRIRAYMANLTSFDGQCVVSSNDLSWVSGEARDMLMQKAGEGSLVLLMPKPNPMSRELVRAGAKAHYYGDASFRLRSRFTVVNANRADAWVAVGYGRKDAHVIREFHSSDDPTLNMAKDLIDMAARLAEKRTK